MLEKDLQSNKLRQLAPMVAYLAKESSNQAPYQRPKDKNLYRATKRKQESKHHKCRKKT